MTRIACNLAHLRHVLGLAIMLFAMASPSQASSIAIQFTATDLPDVVVGDDLWKYQYLVTSDDPFAANQGFSVYFDETKYANLQVVDLFFNSDWDVVTLQPDPTIPDAGLYDALALVDSPALDPFRATFVWRGGAGTTPGAQRFTVNQFDLDGNLVAILAEGLTFTADEPPPPPPPPDPADPPLGVPEPSTLVLMSTGAALAIRRRRCPRGGVAR